MPVREAQATNSLADQGVDVITCHVDSPKVVVETAAKRGLYTCGYHADQSALDPKGYLTGAEWNWPHVYPKFVAEIMAGKTLPNMIRGGFHDGFVKSSPYNAIVPDAVREQFRKREFVIFKGPITSNKGKVVIPAGAAEGEHDVKLEEMDYLVAGVSGTTA